MRLQLQNSEDYNTATLPHQKYYALEEYERRMQAIKMGEDIVEDVGYDPRADEEAAKASFKKRPTQDTESYLSRNQLLELRKVERERIEGAKMKRMGLEGEVKDSMGVRYE